MEVDIAKQGFISDRVKSMDEVNKDTTWEKHAGMALTRNSFSLMTSEEEYIIDEIIRKVNVDDECAEGMSVARIVM